MSELFYIAVIAIDILVIADILKKLKAEVPKFLWIVAVLFLPGVGAAFWYYVQYIVPKQKRIERQERKRVKK
jgi:hypothetical protein